MLRKIVRGIKSHSVAIGAGAVTVVSAVPCHAAAVLDFTGASASLTSEIGPAITAAMPFMGLILAATVGVKLFKKFVK